MARKDPQSWLEATIQFVNTGEEDRDNFVMEFLDRGAIGSAEEPVSCDGESQDAPLCTACGHSVRQCVYFPSEAGLEATLEILDRTIRDFGNRTPDFSARVISCRTVHKQDWATGWRQVFPPEQVGARLWTVPPWEDVTLPPDAIAITLEPGLAFGTGKHATTRHCLRFLEEIGNEDLAFPGRVLDVGCGSAILAIAATLLGAREVVGLEIDPDAVPVAAKNLARNGLADKIRLINGGPECCRGCFDLILANLTAGILLDHGGQLPGLLAPRGLCIVSGLLAHEKAAVMKMFEQEGLRLVREKADHEEGWSTVLLTRPTEG